MAQGGGIDDFQISEGLHRMHCRVDAILRLNYTILLPQPNPETPHLLTRHCNESQIQNAKKVVTSFIHLKPHSLRAIVLLSMMCVPILGRFNSVRSYTIWQLYVSRSGQ